MEMKRLSKELLAAKTTAQEHFCSQYYEMKATAGLNSTSMLKGRKEMGKLFLQSKTTTDRSLRTLLENLIS